MSHIICKAAVSASGSGSVPLLAGMGVPGNAPEKRHPLVKKRPARLTPQASASNGLSLVDMQLFEFHTQVSTINDDIFKMDWQWSKAKFFSRTQTTAQLMN